MMLGWCWHRWSKWVSVPIGQKYIWQEAWSEVAGQTRACEKCGKSQLRKLSWS